MDCLRPWKINWNTAQEKILPCGKCDVCLTKRGLEWKFRINQEARNANAKGIIFLTLTYSDEFLPTVVTDEGLILSTFNKKHIQDYFKRVRKNLYGSMKGYFK